MADNLVRLGSILGGTKNIIGNKYADLVLETLGKVYIKTGNSSRVLNDIFKLLDKFNDLEDANSKTIITEDLAELDYPGDGVLVFDAKNKALYISYDGRYILIIDSLETEEVDGKGYVKRSGDTMTGTLTIKTDGAPLIVASKELVKNLNAEYLGGHSASRFAVKVLNEKIYGEWSFLKKTTFNGITEFNNKAIHNDNLVMDNSDIITTGSIGSPSFASGFLGYGWRFDAKTQMLTVDYLVVRKAMQVFELIVNQIKATNGSLWVTDSCEVEEAFEVYYLNILTDLGTITKDRWYLPYNGVVGNAYTSGCNVLALYVSGESISGPGINDTGSSTTFYNFNYIIKFTSIPSGLTSDVFNDLSNFEGDNDIKVIHLFDENNVSSSTDCQQQLVENTMYNLETTPFFYSTNKLNEFELSEVKKIYSYYKYFGFTPEFDENNLVVARTRRINVVKMKEDTYPTFREGDLVRCLKFEDNNIKYYDALVGSLFDTYYYVMLVADSVFDMSTTIEYSETGELKELTETYNAHLYDKTSQISSEQKQEVASSSDSQTSDSYNESKVSIEDDPTVVLTTIQPKDGLVRIGNLYKTDRQNSVFITSSEEYSPYVLTMSGVDRPDYSVVYTSPRFKTRRKVNSEGQLVSMYYQVSDVPPTDGLLYEVEWVIDNDYSDIIDENVYLTAESDNSVIFILDEGLTVDDYTLAIELEQIYKKLYYKYYSVPNLDCEIEKNSVTGKYKSSYTNHVRARFGRLDGIYHELFGDNQPYGYGLYGDNVFLTGEFFLSNGLAVANIGDDIKFEINNDFGKAGLYIESDGGKPYIVLSADLIKILTANGQQTALFTNGRIETSLLRVSDLEAAEYYKYYADWTLYDSEGNEILDADGNVTQGSEQYSYKSVEGLEGGMATNGHSDSWFVFNEDGSYYEYVIRLDEWGEVFTEIDTNYPYVRISSESGLLEANSAHLLGGVLELYSQDKLTKVLVTALEQEASHAGMIVSTRTSTDSEDWDEKAVYNGEIITDPSKLYKSKNITVNYNSNTQASYNFGDHLKELGYTSDGYYTVCYDKNNNFGYIYNANDLQHYYGVESYSYTTEHKITNEPIVLEDPCDIKLYSEVFANIYPDQYFYENASVWVAITYKKDGIGMGSVMNYSQLVYFDYYGNRKSSYSNFTKINRQFTLSPGTYDLYAKVTVNVNLSNKWYTSLDESYWYGATTNGIVTFPSTITGPDYDFLLKISNIEVLSNQFKTRYFGNGFTSGFNELNYFSVYNNQALYNPAMIIDFQSNGAGMMYKDGIPYQYYNGQTLTMPIPIYSANIVVGNSNSDFSCLNYSYSSQNPLGNLYPIVSAYKAWLNGSVPNGHTRSKLPANGRDSDDALYHGDFVIDFQGLSAYEGIDFSSKNILALATGKPNFSKDSSKTHQCYVTLYSAKEKQLRFWISDDASNNDGDCSIIIYYLPS